MNIRPYPPVILPTRDNPMGLAPEDRADFEAEVAGLVKRIAHAEADPTGRNPHEPGAKVDAGKDEYDMVLFSFPNALAKVDRVGKFGARKYTKGGFLEVPNGQRRYSTPTSATPSASCRVSRWIPRAVSCTWPTRLGTPWLSWSCSSVARVAEQ